MYPYSVEHARLQWDEKEPQENREYDSAREGEILRQNAVENRKDDSREREMYRCVLGIYRLELEFMRANLTAILVGVP